MMARLLLALWLLSAAQPESEAVLLTLQRAASRDDRPAVAALMAFPLNVTAGGVRLPVSDEAAFLQNYDAIITPALRPSCLIQVYAAASSPSASPAGRGR
jgi:hypothetical protein